MGQPKGARYDPLFVYGTLLPDRVRGEISAAARRLRLVGRASVRGRLYDLGAYPGTVPDAATDSVIKGTVFMVPDDAVLACLDEYEGYDPHSPPRPGFVRERVIADFETRRVLRVLDLRLPWRPRGARCIESGDYRAHRASD